KRLHASKNGTGAVASSPSFCKLKIKAPKGGSSPEDTKHHLPIVLKIDQRSPEMPTATLKFRMHRRTTDKGSTTPSPPPLPPSPPTPPSPKQKFADEKSQFLNSFNLTPIKAERVSPTKAPAASTPPSAVESAPPLRKSPPAVSVSGPVAPSAAAPITVVPSSNGIPTTATTTTTTAAATAPTTSQVKRKAKDAAGGGAPRSGPKKPKLSDDEMKAIVEKTVAENIRSPSEHIVPPIFLKPKVPTTVPSSIPSTTTASRQPSPPLASSPSSAKSKEPSPKRDSPRPFVFKTPPPPPPPPIVSANNIPAVKPSQQVLPAPVPQKPSPPPIRPAAAPKPNLPAHAQPHAPIRKPTTPTKLPTSSSVPAAPASTPNVPKALGNGVPVSNATTHSVTTGANRSQKGLELKRAQSNPSINIPPPVLGSSTNTTLSVPRDTEISKLRPEDLKKNSKVYGPTVTEQQQQQAPRVSEAANFAVPSKVAPKTVQSSTSSGNAPSTKSSSSGSSGSSVQGSKARPVNYLSYALMNSKAAAAGSRTPIPSYSSNSPSYSPDSPQYNPNLNFSSKQFKYANPLAYNSHLQNMLNDRKTGSSGGSTSPPSTITIPASSPSPPQERPIVTSVTTAPSTSSSSATTNGNKRPASSLSPPSAEEKKQQPPEKQALLANSSNPLDKFPSGIPDGLSVTLATDEDDAARIKNVNKQLKNNFIEIRALPEVPVTEVKLPLPVSGTLSKQPERTVPPPSQPAKVGAGSPGSMPSAASSVSQQVPRKTASPNVSSVYSAPAKTTVSTTPSNSGLNESLQRKIIDLLEKQTGIPLEGGKPASKTPPAQKPPATPVSRSSTPKVSNYPLNSGKFKLPNATVTENGTVKLNSYREVDLIPKGVSSNGPQKASGGSSSSIGSGGGASNAPLSRMMPPTNTIPKSIVPIAPKPSQQPFANGRMAMSPPIQRSAAPGGGGGYHQPKSKTPPSHLPSMASMGPMFDIQMKSSAAAGGGTPSKKPSLTGGTTLTSATVPRRKIVPMNNSTSLVPLKTPSVPSASSSSSSTSPGGASKMSNFADFITLYPQSAVPSMTPPSSHMQQPPFNPQAALSQMLSDSFLAQQRMNNQIYPFLLQQLAQQQQQQQHQSAAPNRGMPLGLGPDSVTITASPMAPSRNTLAQNSLTVTAIPPGAGGAGGPTSGRGVGGGGAGLTPRGIGGGGPNPASRNAS
uniref:Uncharacterized protein n=1 Tax=Anopheles epiroticus TaxID=199890 RepID=A0A182P1Y1_9DIPT